MQIDHVKISCKEDVLIRQTNFAKKMEQNLYEIISQWKTYGKQLFFWGPWSSRCKTCEASKVRINSILEAHGFL